MRTNFEMYTPAGNGAVLTLCERLDRMIREDRSLDRKDAIALVLAEMTKVATTHGEIFDTEPHWLICGATADAFKARDWQPYDRMDD
jgi:hypothetical protein